jgi:hypothetical protein
MEEEPRANLSLGFHCHGGSPKRMNHSNWELPGMEKDKNNEKTHVDD